MTAPSEWRGEPHTLTVHSMTPPGGPLDDGELEYDIEHPPSCREEPRGEGECAYLVWACELGWHEMELGLAACLHSGGDGLPGPGTYQIESWGAKYYVWAAGAYEYDGGIALIPAEDPQGSAP